MPTQRAHIVLPEDLAAEIDALAGPRGRSAFIVETMREAVKRQRLLAFLSEMERAPAWKEEHHPELKHGSAAWVRQIRQESSDRQRRIEKKLKSGK